MNKSKAKDHSRLETNLQTEANKVRGNHKGSPRVRLGCMTASKHGNELICYPRTVCQESRVQHKYGPYQGDTDVEKVHCFLRPIRDSHLKGSEG